MPERFKDRASAGRELATHLHGSVAPGAIVLGLPRGGVPVAYEVARSLDLMLDVFVVRKLGLPGQPELAMGAIASGGTKILNAAVVAAAHVKQATIDEVVRRETAELERREQRYRDNRAPLSTTGQTVFLIDDGLATGATMRAAIASLREQHPAKLIVAVPVAARQACEMLKEQTDELICINQPDPFYAVGLWYDDFGQTTDEQIRLLLAEFHQTRD